MTDAPQSAAAYDPVPEAPADTDARPLTIVIGADTFAPQVNGSATFSASLAGGMAARGHDVHVVAPSAGPKLHGVFQEEHAGQLITVHRLHSWRIFTHPWYRFAIPWETYSTSRKILRSVKPDVVHFQSNIVVGRGLSGEALKRGIRLIATNHVIPDNIIEFSLLPRFIRGPFIKWLWWDAGRIYGRAEAMTSPTRRAADFMEEHTHLRGVLAISCGLDASNYTPDFSPNKENLIVFVGRVTTEKNIDELISAFALLDPALNAKLEIVGGGELEAPLKAQAVALGVSDRVQFDSYVTTEFLRQALTRAKVFAMPSTAELQSIATMEALATALPVVAANALALPHLVHDGENGYLFEPGDVEEFAARLTDVLTLPQAKLDAFKRESLKIVEAHDINKTVTTFEQLYRGQTVVEPLIEESLPLHVIIRRRIEDVRKRSRRLTKRLGRTRPAE
ncbi:MAG TPA: glycosyltransferase [Galbitalea sp.]|nr:glycosyltransferase [Galbitalea sp.]